VYVAMEMHDLLEKPARCDGGDVGFMLDKLHLSYVIVSK
jgi:hypothetical protein